MDKQYGFLGIIYDNKSNNIYMFICKYCSKTVYDFEEEYDILAQKYKYNSYEDQKCITCLNKEMDNN